jgi:hypothetical protein
VTLLREIQAAATDDATSLGSLLRKALVLGTRIAYEPPVQWVNCELNGYPDDAKVPEYRAWRRCQVLGNFAGPFGSTMRNQPLPPALIDEPLRRSLFGFEMRGGVAQYQEFLDRGDDDIGIPWSQDIVVAYHNRFVEGWALANARRVMALGDLRQVVDSVRTRLLMFSLKIEAEDPDAAETGSDELQLDRASLDRAFHVTVMGSGNIVTVAGRDASQRVTIEAQPDWEELREGSYVKPPPWEMVARGRRSPSRDAAGAAR